MSYLDNVGITRILQRIAGLLNAKANKPTLVTNAPSVLQLEDNTEYRLSGVQFLTLVYPAQSFEVWMKISFASSASVGVTFPSDTQMIGEYPSFSTGQTWEISIKDKDVICWRVA